MIDSDDALFTKTGAWRPSGGGLMDPDDSFFAISGVCWKPRGGALIELDEAVFVSFSMGDFSGGGKPSGGALMESDEGVFASFSVGGVGGC